MSAPRYRLVVEGEVGARYASAFEGMTISAHDGVTEMTGPIIDQSHLRGLLEQIADLGLTLHSVIPLDPENSVTPRKARVPNANPSSRERTSES